VSTSFFEFAPSFGDRLPPRVHSISTAVRCICGCAMSSDPPEKPHSERQAILMRDCSA
jgi:hypothetical protein